MSNAANETRITPLINPDMSGAADTNGVKLLYVSFGTPESKVQINLSDCVTCKCAEPALSPSKRFSESNQLTLQECFGEWGSPRVEEEYRSVFDAYNDNDTQPIPRLFLWNRYPEFKEFLLEHKTAFFHHSEIGGIKSSEYNNELTIRLIEFAGSKGCHFECLGNYEKLDGDQTTDVLKMRGFTIVRDRVGQFYLGLKEIEKGVTATGDISRPSSPTVREHDGSKLPATEIWVEPTATRKSTRKRRTTDPSQYLQETATFTKRGCSQPHLNSDWRPLSPEKRGNKNKLMRNKPAEPQDSNLPTQPLLQVSPPASPPPSRSKFTSSSAPRSRMSASQEQAHTPTPENNDAGSTNKRYMSGGRSKRQKVRPKCSVKGCPNGSVQGGLCVAHGAKIKKCTHPGCNKYARKAGLCRAHGSARKKCEHERCTKVAVQGGRCLSHGAKLKCRPKGLTQSLSEEGRKALGDAYQSFQKSRGEAIEEVVLAKAVRLTGFSEQFVLKSIKAAWQRRQFEPPVPKPPPYCNK